MASYHSEKTGTPKRVYVLVILCLVAFFLLVMIYVRQARLRFAPTSLLAIDYVNSVLREKEKKQSVRVLILGDSTAAKAFNPKISGEDAYSLALYGGRSPESYFILSRLLEKKIFPECLVISFSYNWKPYIKEHFWENIAELHRIQDALSVFQESAKVGLPPGSEFSRPMHLLQILNAKIFRLPASLDVIRDSVFSDKQKNISEYVWKTMKERNGAFNRPKNAMDNKMLFPNHAFLFESFEPHPLFDHYLKKLFALGLGAGASVYFVEPPIEKKISQMELTGNFSKKYRAHMEKMIESQPGVTFVAHNAIYGEELFIDANHLSDEGTSRFMEEISQKIPCLRLAKKGPLSKPI